MQYLRAVREGGGLGDIIRCVSVFQGLKFKYPDCITHFYAPRYLQQLIAPRSPAIDLYIPLQDRTFEGKLLRNMNQPLDLKADYLKSNFQYSRTIDLFCPAMKYEDEVLGLVCQERTELFCEEAEVKTTRPILYPTEEDLLFASNFKEKHKNKKIVCIQVGSTCRSREWPFSYWNQLIGWLIEDGFHVILFDVSSREWGSRIRNKELEICINKPWVEVIGRLLCSSLVICPDSGFYHLAGALKLKTLGIFSSTSGQVISRIWDKTHHYFQLTESEIDESKLPKTSSKKIACNPICYMQYARGWDNDRYKKRKEYCAIMQQVKPEMVYRRVRELI